MTPQIGLFVPAEMFKTSAYSSIDSYISLLSNLVAQQIGVYLLVSSKE